MQKHDEDEDDEEEKDEDDDEVQVSGKADAFVKKKQLIFSEIIRDDEQLLYPSFDLFTRHRRVSQIHLLNAKIRKMLLDYNEKFYDVQQQKAKIVAKITQINERIMEILKELESSNKQVYLYT